MSNKSTAMFAIRRENGTFFIGFGAGRKNIMDMVPYFDDKKMSLLSNKDLAESVPDIKKFFSDIEIVSVDITPIPKV